jgi:hypothetical protein
MARLNSVLFSDESRFLSIVLIEDSVSIDKRYVAACIREVDRFRGWSVMVWAAHGHKTDLIFIDGALNAPILQPVYV